MHKVIATWNGFPGAPGVSNFYFGGTTTDTAADVQVTQGRVRAFFAAFTLGLPTPITIQVQQDSPVIDPATGNLTGLLTAATAQTLVTGAGGSNYSAISGGCVIWKSVGYVAGRNLRGKTFLVPLSTAAYDTDGTLLASRLAEIRTAASLLAAIGSYSPAQQLSVWHRPVAGSGGIAIHTETASVNDRVAFLKSRRA
jgi:hypothetical protein